MAQLLALGAHRPAIGICPVRVAWTPDSNGSLWAVGKLMQPPFGHGPSTHSDVQVYERQLDAPSSGRYRSVGGCRLAASSLCRRVLAVGSWKMARRDQG